MFSLEKLLQWRNPLTRPPLDKALLNRQRLIKNYNCAQQKHEIHNCKLKNENNGGKVCLTMSRRQRKTFTWRAFHVIISHKKEREEKRNMLYLTFLLHFLSFFFIASGKCFPCFTSHSSQVFLHYLCFPLWAFTRSKSCGVGKSECETYSLKFFSYRDKEQFLKVYLLSRLHCDLYICSFAFYLQSGSRDAPSRHGGSFWQRSSGRF